MTHILIVMFVVGLITAVVSVAMAVFNLMRTLEEVRTEKRFMSNLLAPFSLFLPGFFTEKGNHFRHRFFIYLLVSIVSMLAVFFLRELIESSQ